MSKIKLIFYGMAILFVAGLLFIMWLQSKQIASLKTDNSILRANTDVLINKLEKEHNDKLEVSRKNTELKAKIDNYKGDFDWRTDLSNNPVLLEFKRLYKN